MSFNSVIPEPELKQGRRKFLLRLSWTGLGLCAATLSAAVLNFFWPRVSGRPTRSIQVGFPEDYQAGQVVYHRGRKLFVVRDEIGFYSLSAKCTHLGCMVVWNRDHRMFLCPCHGGKFDAKGLNVEGPPPRPLDLLAIRLADNGSLVVDPDSIIKRERRSVPHLRPEAT